jgi:hypothetical protein
MLLIAASALRRFKIAMFLRGIGAYIQFLAGVCNYE